VSGAIYGAVSEVLPLATAGFGTLFGTAVWLAADEVAVPALGLGPTPVELPLSHHAQYLGGHLIYGAITDAVRRGLLAVM